MADTAETIRPGDLTRRIGPRRGDELGRLAAVLDSCFAALEHALERQRRFAADASHELRTRLAAIRANLELLRGWAATEPAARRAAIGSLDQATTRATRIVEDLLLLNVLDTALRVSPPDGTVTVELAVAGRQATITVSDDGSLPLEHDPRIGPRDLDTRCLCGVRSRGTA